MVPTVILFLIAARAKAAEPQCTTSPNGKVSDPDSVAMLQGAVIVGDVLSNYEKDTSLSGSDIESPLPWDQSKFLGSDGYHAADAPHAWEASGREITKDLKDMREINLAESEHMLERAVRPTLNDEYAEKESSQASYPDEFENAATGFPEQRIARRRINTTNTTGFESHLPWTVPYYSLLDALGLRSHAVTASGLFALVAFEVSVGIICCCFAAIGVANDATEDDLTPWYCDPCVEIGQCCTSTCNPIANPYIVTFFCVYGLFMNIAWVLYAGQQAAEYQSQLILGIFLLFFLLGTLFGLMMICSKQLRRIPGYKKFVQLPDALDDVTDFLGITECSDDDEQSMFQMAKSACGGGAKKKEDKKAEKAAAKKAAAGKLAKKTQDRKKAADASAGGSWY